MVEPLSRNLAKALLVQSAVLRVGPIDVPDLTYRGFWIPREVDDILTCALWQATLIFEPEIHAQRRIFTREGFPFPTCFRRSDGWVEGDFLITLAYDPLLEPTAGAECCQVHVDASLGTVDAGADGKPFHEGKIPLEPRDNSKLYERNLVEYGFKWSPLKVYRKHLTKTSAQRWRIQLRLVHRAGLATTVSQCAALVVTFFDRERQKPVYNNVVTAMNRARWVSQDLRVDERIRARPQT